MVWDAALTPWDEIEIQGGPVQISIRPASQYHDPETGLSCNRRRDDDPTTDRFMQPAQNAELTPKPA